MSTHLVPIQPAVVLPWGAYFIVRDCGDALLAKARELEANERTHLAGEQLRRSLAWLEVTAERQWEAHRIAQAAQVREDARAATRDARGLAPAAPLPDPVAAGWDTSTSIGLRLDVDQVAEQLSLSKSQVRKLCHAKRLSATKHGNSWVITQAAVDDYLRAEHR